MPLQPFQYAGGVSNPQTDFTVTPSAARSDTQDAMQGLVDVVKENKQQSEADIQKQAILERYAQAKMSLEKAMQSGDPNEVEKVKATYPDLTKALDIAGRQTWKDDTVKETVLQAMYKATYDPQAATSVLGETLDRLDQINASQTAKNEVMEMMDMYRQAAQTGDYDKAKKVGLGYLAAHDTERAKEFNDMMNPTSKEESKTNDIKNYEYGVEHPEFVAAQRAEKAAAAGEEALTKNFKDEQDLRKEYLKESGEYVKVRDAYTRVKGSTADPSPAGDLSLIFNYMKMLDPGSTVREGEFASAAASGSYGERFKAAANKIMNGERLTESMRADFVSKSKVLYEGMQKQHKQREGTYTALAKRYGFNPADIVSNLDEAAAAPLPEGVTEADIAQQMKTYGISREETIRRYGGK